MKYGLIGNILFFLSLLPYTATATDFAYNQKWLKLLHYKQSISGYRGLIDSNEFYLAGNGRYNPAAELQANITKLADGKQKCNFPARFELLKEQGLLSGNLDDCADYQQFLQDVQPAGITVLFTNAYMSNPASLFGHTLLRIDTARKGSQMLAHGVNFGAASGTETGFVFALKGLFGGYDGTFGIGPYWNIINTYNNIENRDIWEYRLNLSQAELHFFTAHIYELRQSKVRYYFLSKNCSYMILELLDAVRPELNLTEKYQWQTIPLDTLKTLKNTPHLLKDVNYRPARYTRIQARLQKMSAPQYRAFLEGTNGNYSLSDLSDADKTEVLDALYEYYQYQYTARKIKLKEYRRNSFTVLRQRSLLPIKNAPIISGENPTLSHDSRQVALLGGVYNHRSFEQLQLRPAYTSLTDNGYGLIKGAEINVLTGIWRYYNQKHRLVLHKITPLSIKSLVPADKVFQPISYVTDMSVKREFKPTTAGEGYVADFNIGVGKTYPLPANLWLYGMTKAGGQYGGFIPHNQLGSFKPEIGIYADYGLWRVNAGIEKSWATQKFGNRLKYEVSLSAGISVNLSADIKFMTSRNYGKNQQELIGGLHYNF
jgi:hypothetical protein